VSRVVRSSLVVRLYQVLYQFKIFNFLKNLGLLTVYQQHYAGCTYGPSKWHIGSMGKMLTLIAYIDTYS